MAYSAQSVKTMHLQELEPSSAILFHHIQVKADICTAYSENSAQLAPKLSRWINSTKRENYIFDFGVNYPFNSLEMIGVICIQLRNLNTIRYHFVLIRGV